MEELEPEVTHRVQSGWKNWSRKSPTECRAGGRTGAGSHPPSAERVEELEESVWSVVRQENEREDQGEGLPQSCTHEDREEFNPRARSCAQHWAGVV